MTVKRLIRIASTIKESSSTLGYHLSQYSKIIKIRMTPLSSSSCALLCALFCPLSFVTIYYEILGASSWNAILPCPVLSITTRPVPQRIPPFPHSLLFSISSYSQCEIARMSVLQSGWAKKYKLHFLGEDFCDIRETNVPNIRLMYRKETLDTEISDLHIHSA